MKPIVSSIYNIYVIIAHYAHRRKGEAREGLKYKYVVGRADVGPRVGIKIPQLGIRYFSTNYIY